METTEVAWAKQLIDLKEKEGREIVLPKDWAYAAKDYKLKRIIGKGTYGMVVKAKDRESGEVVAIKMVNIADHVLVY